MSFGKRSQQIRESVAIHGMKGPTPVGEYAFWCPFCEGRGHKVDEYFKGTLRISGTAKVRPAPDEPAEEIEVTPEGGVYHCWRCGVHGVTDLSWVIEEGFEIPKPAQPPSAADLGRQPEFEILDPARAEHAAFVRYLTRVRKVDVLEEALAAGACVSRSGRYAGRVVLPHVEGGAWRGFAARAIFGQEPRYLTPRGMPRREILYCIETVDRSRPAWLVEGGFDALALWGRAVGTYGTGITDEQVDLAAASFPAGVVVCLDADAWKKARALAARFRLRGVPAAWARLPPGEDPGSIGWRVRRYVETG